MANLFNTFLSEPLLNVLIFFYNTIALKDLGLAIIFLTILIRLILFPVFQKSARHQKEMQAIQPKIKKIQETHKGDREKQAQAMMAVYKEHKLNPFSGFLLLLVQIPILISLYHVFAKSLNSDSLVGLYNFISRPAELNYSFLGLISLAESNIFIVGLAAILQYWQGKLSLPKLEAGQALTAAEKMGRNMVFIGPILTVVILFNLPSALGLFWLVSSLFSVGQQLIINRENRDGSVDALRQKTS